MATLHTALLLLLATGWTAEGSPRDQGESKALTTLGVPPSTLSTIGRGGSPLLGSERLTGSQEEEDDDEEDYSDEYELSGSEELHDAISPAKVQAVVKPQNKDQRIKGSKNLKVKGRKNKNRRKKKPNPCKTTFKDYCIHGKCKYLKDLDKPSCICLPGYQNERCGIQALQTGKNEKHFDSLSVTLIVVGVALLIFTLTAVTTAVTLHMKKKMRVEGETESEDKQKLRSENGIVV